MEALRLSCIAIRFSMQTKGEWDGHRLFIRVVSRRPTSAQLVEQLKLINQREAPPTTALLDDQKQLARTFVPASSYVILLPRLQNPLLRLLRPKQSTHPNHLVHFVISA